jgi:hypothetical protein
MSHVQHVHVACPMSHMCPVSRVPSPMSRHRAEGQATSNKQVAIAKRPVHCPTPLYLGESCTRIAKSPNPMELLALSAMHHHVISSAMHRHVSADRPNAICCIRVMRSPEYRVTKRVLKLSKLGARGFAINARASRQSVVSRLLPAAD